MIGTGSSSFFILVATFLVLLLVRTSSSCIGDNGLVIEFLFKSTELLRD